MCEKLADLAAAAGEKVSALDPASMSTSEATASIEHFSRLERFAQVGRALVLQQCFKDRPWHGEGYRTAAEWLSAKTKKTLSSSIATVATAWNLQRLPATREQFVAGKLSEYQAHQITEAASADPGSEQGLLQMAAHES